MSVDAKQFKRQFPSYKDFLAAIQNPDLVQAQGAMKEVQSIVGEDDLVDDYFAPLRAGDFRADNYIFKKYEQVMTLAAA